MAIMTELALRIDSAKVQVWYLLDLTIFYVLVTCI
jgi:hypothetical protein